jgi:D-serine deaminase-like pyridoxal phosphate-dependent protein
VADLSSFETPFLAIDLDAFQRNVARAQSYCDEHRLAFRPHVKTHKQPALARKQVEAGAVGITCQKLGEAEVMADGGLDDVLLTYPLLGPAKEERLATLVRRIRVAVAADSRDAVEAAGRAGRAAGREVGFLVECDGGLGRLGVTDPDAAADLAERAVATEGVSWAGLMTYPTSERTRPFMEATRAALARCGLEPPVVSGGGTPTLYRTHELDGLTEVRAGEYAFGDRAHVTSGVVSLTDVAVGIVATVVGRPDDDHVILDAGSKTLSSDPCASGDAGFGLVRDLPEAVLSELWEEHARLEISRCRRPPVIGDRLTIVPNHVCGAINLHDEVVLHGSGEEARWAPVPARGRVR